MNDVNRLLRVYLEDHAAGAAAGLALARRIADRYGDEPGYGALHDLAREIEEDRDHLDSIRAHLGANGGAWKASLAIVAERVRRLKHLEPWHDDDALSRVEELEELAAGVQGKLGLWEALDTANVPMPAGLGPSQLGERARAQLATLDALHRRAASLALGERSAPADA